MTADVALRLGRVSNLPTVWTNALAGVVLAGGVLGVGEAVRLGIALSLFYVGGMYLNDAFDHAVDARERPTRPIPSGAVSARTVYLAGAAMLVLGWAMLGAVSETRLGPLLGLALGAAIVVLRLAAQGRSAGAGVDGPVSRARLRRGGRCRDGRRAGRGGGRRAPRPLLRGRAHVRRQPRDAVRP